MRAVSRSMLVVIFALLFTVPLLAQSRKPITNPAPVYPELAKRMHLTGVVKATITVGPDGQIKNVEFQGGHPVLIEAVQETLKAWKYAPAPVETKIQAEFKF